MSESLLSKTSKNIFTMLKIYEENGQLTAEKLLRNMVHRLLEFLEYVKFIFNKFQYFFDNACV